MNRKLSTWLLVTLIGAAFIAGCGSSSSSSSSSSSHEHKDRDDEYHYEHDHLGQPGSRGRCRRL